MAAPSTSMMTAWGCSLSLIIRSPKVRFPRPPLPRGLAALQAGFEALDVAAGAEKAALAAQDQCAQGAVLAAASSTA